MVSKKYAKDFEVVYDETPGGKLKARAVYTGRFYVFSDTAEGIKKTAALFTALSFTAWIAFVIPLLILSEAARTSYVIIPHACVFMPLLFMSVVAYDLWTAKQPFTREKSDHIAQRTPKSALFMTVFSAIGAAGFVLLLLTGADLMMPGDLIFGLCEAVILAVSILLLVSRRRTATQESK